MTKCSKSCAHSTLSDFWCRKAMEAEGQIAKLQAYIDTQPYPDEYADLLEELDEARRAGERVRVLCDGLAVVWTKDVLDQLRELGPWPRPNPKDGGPF